MIFLVSSDTIGPQKIKVSSLTETTAQVVCTSHEMSGRPRPLASLESVRARQRSSSWPHDAGLSLETPDATTV